MARGWSPRHYRWPAAIRGCCRPPVESPRL